MKSSTTFVTLGCAAAVALALVGAAYAFDTPTRTSPMETLEKGDSLAPSVRPPGDSLTIEEANPDAGISNLVIVDTQGLTAL